LLWERKFKKTKRKKYTLEKTKKNLSNAAALDFQKIFKKFSKKKSRHYCPIRHHPDLANETHERR